MIRLLLLGCCSLVAASGCARFGFDEIDLDAGDGAILDAGDGADLDPGDGADAGDGGNLDAGDGDASSFSWRSLGPEHWPELQRRLQDTANQGSTGDPTVRLIPNADLAALPNDRHQGAILAPNGRIYGIPRMASQVVELELFAASDPVVSLLGPDIGGADKWYGAALAWDGMIYCSVSDSNFPLLVDPDNLNNSTELTSTDLGTDLDKWVGLRVVPNGKLLSCPRNDEYVLEIDPNGHDGVEIRRVGPALGTATYKWWGGVLAPNGKIYCLPNNDERILEIDPEDLSATGIKRVGPDFGTVDEKWWGGALAPNGRIYAAPNGDSHVLEIVPDDIDSSARIGPDFGTALTRKWAAGTLAPNGKIYAVPGRHTQVLEIDPEDHSAFGIRVLSPVMLETIRSKYFGAALAPNGKIYAFPWQGSIDILEIDPHARANFDMDVLLNGHLNGQ